MPRRPVGLSLPVGTIKQFGQTVERDAPLLEKRFQLGEMLGQGSHATVRKITKRGNATPGAVALITKTYKTDDEEMVNIANREFQILRLVRGHPNVMQCREILIDTPHGRVDLILRMAPGISLSSLVSNEGHLNEDRARPILEGLLRALLWCHSKRVVHRDVKPDNILVDENGERGTGAVLCDFNTACCLGRDCSDALAGGATPTGTVDWLSPECANTTCPGEMVDIWAAGLCLHYMLAGRLPWSGKSWSAVMQSVKSVGEIEPPAGTTEEAADLLRGLLQKDLSARLLVCGALAHAWFSLSLPALNELLFADDQIIPVGDAATLCIPQSAQDTNHGQDRPMRVSFQVAATSRHSKQKPIVNEFGMTSSQTQANAGYPQINGLNDASAELSRKPRSLFQGKHNRRTKRSKTIHGTIRQDDSPLSDEAVADTSQPQ
eukprot:gnl/MRDRNA2_/MRDRNA2_29754_c0_seq1.p1 gnl/MRDRNA2_/MRDRNA2_29754_c0~~gnl/MRDRNA2_/MRDRNA2_29754_c0_seq1.p1  ORF type:complete len:435 (-),score=67.40 gnl/MRDRNA2_/MRDRNA2_29754_c0_seq1:164-1468(-)